MKPGSGLRRCQHDQHPDGCCLCLYNNLIRTRWELRITQAVVVALAARCLLW